MNLYLVRHGLSMANLAGRYQGWADSVLAPFGLSQARQTGAFFAAYAARHSLAFDALYSSPLRRAWQTAEMIGEWLRLAPLAVPELREMHGGAIEDLTDAEWQARYPSLVAPWRDLTNLEFAWPGGETRRAFRARCRSALTALLAQHTADAHIIVVAHGGVISAYLAAGDGVEPGGAEGGDIANCSITHVQFAAAPGSGGSFRVLDCLRLYNDVGHLAELDKPVLVLEGRIG